MNSNSSRPDEAEQHGQAAEEDRPTGRRDGDHDRASTASRSTAPSGRRPPPTRDELLAEAARHEQRVVDAEAEAEERGQVEHEDAHRRHRGEAEDARPGRRRTAVPPTTSGTPAATTRAEHEQQREGGQRQRDELAAPQVGLGHRLDVAVERRPAGQQRTAPRAPAAGRSRGPPGPRASRPG